MLRPLLATGLSFSLIAALVTTANAAPVDWTGFYASVMGGGTVVAASYPGGYGNLSGSYYGNVTNTAIGFNVGAGVGADIQVGAFVLGVDGDISWTGTKAATQFSPSLGESNAKVNWFATVRGKAGITLDDTALLYATAGVAFTNSTFASCYNKGCDPAYAGDDYGGTLTHVGLALGVGGEVKISDNFGIKAEALYLAMPNVQFSPTNNPNEFAFFNDSSLVGRVGLNWYIK